MHSTRIAEICPTFAVNIIAAFLLLDPGRTLRTFLIVQRSHLSILIRNKTRSNMERLHTFGTMRSHTAIADPLSFLRINQPCTVHNRTFLKLRVGREKSKPLPLINILDNLPRQDIPDGRRFGPRQFTSIIST